MKTVLISRKEIERVFSMKDYLDTIEEAFRIYGEGGIQMPPKVYLCFAKGDVRCMPVYIPSIKFAGVKNVNVHPGNRDMPTVMATITLFDPENGFPVAIMDGTHITNMRTGAAGGVAAKFLSKKDSKTLALIGSGVQAATQLQAIKLVRDIKKIRIFDVNEDAMKMFASKYNAEACSSIEEAMKGADIVVTTTPVNKPIVKASYVEEGMHINAIGADAEGKQELEGKILKKANVIIDNWEQASHSGEINVPITEKIITKDDILADIGEITAKKKVGRKSERDITVFDSTGLAIQDISAAAAIYNKLKKSGKDLMEVELI